MHFDAGLLRNVTIFVHEEDCCVHGDIVDDKKGRDLIAGGAAHGGQNVVVHLQLLQTGWNDQMYGEMYMRFDTDTPRGCYGLAHPGTEFRIGGRAIGVCGATFLTGLGRHRLNCICEFLYCSPFAGK